MDPILNCLLGVCCPPDSVEQQAMAAKFFAEYASVSDPTIASACGAAMLKYFDLAEKGSLSAFKASIVRVSKA